MASRSRRALLLVRGAGADPSDPLLSPRVGLLGVPPLLVVAGVFGPFATPSSGSADVETRWRLPLATAAKPGLLAYWLWTFRDDRVASRVRRRGP